MDRWQAFTVVGVVWAIAVIVGVAVYLDYETTQKALAGGYMQQLVGNRTIWVRP